MSNMNELNALNNDDFELLIRTGVTTKRHSAMTLQKETVIKRMISGRKQF